MSIRRCRICGITTGGLIHPPWMEVVDNWPEPDLCPSCAANKSIDKSEKEWDWFFKEVEAHRACYTRYGDDKSPSSIKSNCREDVIYLQEPPGSSVVGYIRCNGREIASIISDGTDEDGERIALALRALEVMTRRSWGVSKSERGWQVNNILGLSDECPEFVERFWCEMEYDNPFTAVVEADKWYRKWEESKGAITT
jgi:hypothetical protein